MDNGRELEVVLGTGPIGLAVVEQLHAAGVPVRAVNRSGSAPVPEGVEIRAGDCSDAAFVHNATVGAAVVYNCLNPPYTEWPQLLPGLWSAVTDGVAEAGARLVVMDNLYMYGPTGGKPLKEDLPYAATGPKGKTRAQVARALLEANAAGKVQVAIGRASDYYGPRGLMSHMGERAFYPAISGGKVQMFGDPDLAHTFNYIGDIAAGLITLGSHDEAFGQVWHLPVAETVTSRQFVDRIYAQTGNEAGIQVMPKLMMNVVAVFNRPLKELQEVLYQFEQPWVVDHTKFDAAFGGTATPLDDAIGTTLDWYRANPK